MDISKTTYLVSTTILLLIYSNSSFGQKLEPKERITEPDHTLSSELMGKDYQLYMSFPKSYSTKDTISYPVLYVLDGRIAFPSIKGTKDALDLFGDDEIEDVIIVGIGSGLNTRSWAISRTYDYTISIDTIHDRNREKQRDLPEGTVKSGGADEFLKCLKTEIIPFVDKHYKTNTDRGITGHSFGGLFAAWCLIESDGYFTRLGISSPSFWWDNEKLLNKAVSQLTTNESFDIPATKVFICVGENEGHMVSLMEKFKSNLETADYENIDLNWQIFDGESHLSVWPASISKTITTLYGKK
jgi:predicted alpha/beta superfamily hydrolase